VLALVPDGLVSVTAGGSHDCGLTPAGEAYCWGDGAWGQLGGGDTVRHAAPTRVAGNLHFTSLAGGERHTCGLTDARKLFCWGLDDHRQLGMDAGGNCYVLGLVYSNYLSPISCALVPQPVPGAFSAFVAIAAGYGTCGLTEEGEVLCFGLSPGVVSVSHGIRFASLSSDGNCGLTVDGLAYCWAQGSTTDEIRWFGTTLPVGNGQAFQSISANNGHQCGVLRQDGSVVCWGNNDLGQLGNGTTAFGPIPLPVKRPANP